MRGGVIQNSSYCFTPEGVPEITRDIPGIPAPAAAGNRSWKLEDTFLVNFTRKQFVAWRGLERKREHSPTNTDMVWQ